jgi:hypothetical protein
MLLLHRGWNLGDDFIYISDALIITTTNGLMLPYTHIKAIQASAF